MGYTTIEVEPLATSLGAEVRGVDLSKPLVSPALDEVRRAFLDHAVLVFPDQRLEPRAQIDFARHFGTPECHAIVNGTEEFPELIRVWKPAGERASFGTGWHTDNSFAERPSSASTLYALVVPPHGGDTLFASMEAAYGALSEPMRALLAELTGVHSAAKAYDPSVTGAAKYRGEGPITYRYSDAIYEEVLHPVVRTHPDTGRKSLYVNPMFTTGLRDLERREASSLLRFLYAHYTQPEFTCRIRWRPGDLALWDNRCVQHYAMDDYRAHERLMHRVTVVGERPV